MATAILITEIDPTYPDPEARVKFPPKSQHVTSLVWEARFCRHSMSSVIETILIMDPELELERDLSREL